MSRRTDGRGTDLEDALVDALSDLLDVDPDRISVRVDAPGLDALSGDVRLDLQIEAATEGQDGADEAPAAARGEAEVATSSGSEQAQDAASEDERTDDERAEDERAPDGDADAEATAPGPIDDGHGAAEPADDALAEDERDAGVEDERDAGAKDEREAADEDDAHGVRLTAEDLDDEADAAADFLEGLLDALDLPGDIRIRVADDHAEVEVVEIGSGALIGRRGQTLEAIQEVVRCVLQREFQRRSRVKVDAEGYRARRLEKLLEKAEEAVDDVLDSGEPVRLEPMDVFERKAVHRLVAEVDGVASRSQGREPARRVVIELE